MNNTTRILLGSTALCRISTVTASLMLASGPALALPQNGTVAGGSASIVQSSPSQLDINQTSNHAVIDWQSFSIAAGETTAFHQPSAGSIAVNRVSGVDPSQIMGRLTANGQVVLVNPNGILFDKGAQVNVGGLVATTSGISTANAMAGTMSFDRPSTSSTATVVNRGTITAAEGGLVALVAPGVANSGVITANLGKVALASGNKWTLDLYGDHLVSFAVNDQLVNQVAGPDGAGLGVSHSGTITASGGRVELSANIAKGVVTNAINMNGIIEANSISSQGGTIVLNGGTSGVAITGTANASGTSGGTISVAGDTVIHQGVLRADGTAGAGGAITTTAASTYIDTASAVTSANGTAAGGSIAVTAGTNLYSSGHHSAASTGGTGGTIVMTAPKVDIFGADIDASGAAGGGAIFVGGGTHGAGPIAHAVTTTINASSTLTASATHTGNGGTITIWSDDATVFAGTATAKGGSASGNGGAIEVSSAGSDSYAGIADAGAPQGVSGQLLLDPKTIIVDNVAGLFPQFGFINPDPTLGGIFGSVTVMLSTGNIVVTDANATFGLGPLDVGASYLFNGLTGQLISTLTGSFAGDHVGAAVTALTGTGNYVVSQSAWDGGIGAATFGSGTLGVSGVVSSSNSLIGSTAGDNVGLSVTALTNGNYVVGSSNWNGNRGAATWGSGTAGVTGTVTSGNSLTGSSAGDHVGLSVTALTNGNYVVGSPDWNGNRGGASWGNGATGLTGAVSAATSLIGSTAGDEVGLAATALTNGNYVVGSPDWNGTRGAASWGSGTLGIDGTISTSNSLTGSLINDQVGLNITALANGNYVVGSPDWNGNRGAATWGSGSAGLDGTVSVSNSLTGTLAGDKVGLLVGALANGNYVVGSPDWNLGRGAATWGSGATGFSGTITAANSLVGSLATDQVGLSVTALTNGNYVVASPDWNGTRGAATWGNGTVGIDGTVSAGNSLTGSLVADQVGLNVTALTNGNYVVGSPDWNLTRGAATFANGAVGLSGTVSNSNSLVGSLVTDEVGLHVAALTDGSYVVGSPLWAATLGAATWASGTLGISGTVSSGNSLVGSLVGDLVGSSVATLNGGAYVVGSFGWNGGLGAATYGAAQTALTGTISTLNSIIGGGVQSLPGILIQSIGTTGNFLVDFASIAGGELFEGVSNPNGFTYSDAEYATVTIAPSSLTQTLNTGTAVTLQADDDIRVNSAIVTSAGGSGGALTLMAGRSLILNAGITTDNGNLTLIANDTAADGVVNASRDAGNAVISMANGTALNARTGAVSILMNTGAGITNAASGGITLNNVTGGTISVTDQTLGTLTTNGNLHATGAGNSLVLDAGALVNTAGSTALNPGTGRYLLYTASPVTNTLDGLTGFAVHYASTLTNTPPSSVTSGGNDSFYSLAPTLTIDIGSANRLYGAANASLSYTPMGLVGSDTVSTALSALPTLATAATTASGVGSYAITASNTLTSPTGYNIVVVNGALSVTPAPLTITPGSASRVYGAVNPTLSATYSGFVNGDGAGVVSGLSLATTATTLSNVGSYAITATGASAVNYAITYGASGALTITQAPLTITANNASRLYGSANPAFSATYNGLVNGDGSGVVTNLMLSTSATSASNVGAYTIVAGNGSANNYAISYVNGTLSVTPAPLTIAPAGVSRLYGAANPVLSATYTGLVNNDPSSVVSGLMLATTATSASNVGSYAITAAGATAANYTIAYGPSATLAVTPAPLTITPTSSSRPYGGTDTLGATYAGLVNNDTSSAIANLTLATPATTASPVGSYAVTAAGASDANYVITYGPSGTITVTPAPLTITSNSASRAYGAANPVFSASYSGLVNGETSTVISGLTLATTATSASNVGSYAITASGASDANYAITYGPSGTLAIGQVPLTITATSLSRLYGANNPALSATYTGLVNGDSSGVVTNLMLATAATSASNVGSYAITAAGGSATNYAISYVNGALAVLPAPLTITPASASRLYGAANPVLSATYSGLVNGDTSAALAGLSLTTTATPATSVGSYAITATGASDANYAIAYGPSGTLSVLPAPLTITPNNSTRAYGASNVFTATFAGLVAGDSSTSIAGLALTSMATAASGVGSYAITAGSGVDPNYTISYGASAVLSVVPAPLTITPNSGYVLEGTAPMPSASYSGLVAGDGPSAITGLVFSTMATSTSPLGNYAVTASGASSPNYAIGYGPNGVLSVVATLPTPPVLQSSPPSDTPILSMQPDPTSVPQQQLVLDGPMENALYFRVASNPSITPTIVTAPSSPEQADPDIAQFMALNESDLKTAPQAYALADTGVQLSASNGGRFPSGAFIQYNGFGSLDSTNSNGELVCLKARDVEASDTGCALPLAIQGL